MPQIDVVILNWNGQTFLEQYLPPLVKNTPAEEANIIVADNGSTDNSIEWLKSNYEDRISVVTLEKNYGFAEGYNRALENLTSPLVVLINSDVEVTENWLGPLISAIQPDSIAAVMPKILSTSKTDHFEYAGASGGFIDRWGFPFCRGRILDTLEKDTGQYDTNRNIFWATGACMMIKTEVFHKAGGFDPFFFAHMEEIDLCWRIQTSGYKILAVPSSAVYHVGGGTLPKGNQRKIYLNVRNSMLTLYKNLPKRNLISILLVRMILDGLAALKFLFEGSPKNFSAVLRAHIGFYKSRKRYRPLRKQNQNIKHPRKLSGYYPGSIVLDYYLRGKRVFSRISSKVRE